MAFMSIVLDVFFSYFKKSEHDRNLDYLFLGLDTSELEVFFLCFLFFQGVADHHF